MKPYGLKALNEFIMTVLLSNNLKNAKPLSAMIMGLPDSGKTETIIQYVKNDKIFVASDITGYGLSTLLNDIKYGKIRCIVIPDVSRVMEGRGKAAETLISALNSLIEEGVYNIKTKNSNIELEGKEPVKVSVIGTMTITSYSEKKDDWAHLGFLSRLVPFFLNYTREDIDKALQTIMKEEKVFVDKKVKFLEITDSVEVIISDEYKNDLKKISEYIGRVNQDFTCFRSFKNLLYLAKSHALYRNDTVVNNEDMKFIRSLLPFWFYGYDMKIGSSGRGGGNDCEFYILQHLPNKFVNLLQELNGNYSEKTIMENFEGLKKKGLVKQNDKDEWELVV